MLYVFYNLYDLGSDTVMPSLTKEQQTGVTTILKSLSNRRGFILADRMGFGKTAQGITVAKQVHAKKQLPVLIIVPAYLRYNWQKELTMWGVTPDNTLIIENSKELPPLQEFNVISYNMAVTLFSQLYKYEYSLIICDEGHYLKNTKSGRTKLILGTRQRTKTCLLSKCNRMLLLTGTPIINSVEDLYNTIIRLSPDSIEGMGKEEFLHTYAKYVQYTPYGLKPHGVKNLPQLKKVLKDCMLMREKIEGLPERTDNIVWLDPKEVKKYIEIEESHYDTLDICKVPTFIGDVAEARQRIARAKIKLFEQAYRELPEKYRSFIVYVHHKKSIEELKRIIPMAGVIDGRTSIKKRQEIIDRFQAGETNVIIASIGALKEGVNLTAGKAVVFLELPWTSEELEQCIGRIHRRGQDDPISVYYWLFDGGIDKHMWKTVLGKKKVIEKVKEAVKK